MKHTRMPVLFSFLSVLVIIYDLCRRVRMCPYTFYEYKCVCIYLYMPAKLFHFQSL